VLRQFGFFQTIHGHPITFASPVTALQQVFAAYANFLVHVLCVEELGDNVLHGFETTYIYMKW